MGATCVVVDSHAMFRSSVGSALAQRCDLRVVAEARDAAEAAAAVSVHAPFLVLIDAELPGDGIGLCRTLKEERAAQAVLVIGHGDGEPGLLAAMEAGADGFIDRGLPLDDAVEAVQAVSEGRAYVPPGMLAPLLRGLIERNRDADRALQRFMQLTRREREIVELLAEGCDQQAVADILVISPQTARTHIQNVIAKLGVHSRLEVVTLVAEHGLLDRLERRGA